MLGFLKKFFSDFFYLIYPEVCLNCGKHLSVSEECICLECLYKLPLTNFHEEKNNYLEQIFNEKCKIENATSYVFFSKKSIIQKLIHKLKYNGKKEIGLIIGKQMGLYLFNSKNFFCIDLIIPIPLHKKREKTRGYNQSEWIGKGISKSMNKKMNINSVVRSVNTETQTKKNKEEREKNVKGIFKIKNAKELENKHILLIDDVITTGSTMIECVNTISKLKNTKISIATIAVAVKF